MRKSLKYQIWLLLLCILQTTNSIVTAAGPQLGGGGMFLYRFNNGELEFLFACDSNRKNSNRFGFEYLGGSIGDHPAIDGKIDSKQPLTFLNGSIRETLEELLSFPTVVMQKTRNPNNTKKMLFEPTAKNPFSFDAKKNKYTVDAKHQQEAISHLATYLYKAGVFLLHHSHANIFFWNATAFTTHPKYNFLDELVKYRITSSKQKGFYPGQLGAEPTAFAWVKAKDLLPILSKNGFQWVPVSEYAECDKNNLIHIDRSNLAFTDPVTKKTTPMVDSKTKSILLSPVCMYMINDDNRKFLKHDAFVMQNPLDLIYDKGQLAKQKSTGFPQGSTMRGIINMLITQKIPPLT